MITYFKYSNGDAFHLNGIPYYGFFNVSSDKEAFTGKIKTDHSLKLTPTETFISDFYLNKMEFDNNVNKIDSTNPVYANVFDIINKEELDKTFDVINKNNLSVFKSLFLYNPQIADFDSNDSFYYGLSSSPVDGRNDDTMVGKNSISHIDQFSYFPEWEFLDNIKYGSLFVQSDQKFKYLCTTGEDIITIKGSFIDKTYFEYTIENLDIPREVFQIQYDEFGKRINIIINDEILIYDAVNYIECDTLVLIDSIKLKDVDSKILKWSLENTFSTTFGRINKKFYNINPNPTEFMRFGNNYKVSVDDNIFYVWNKYTSDLIYEINLKNWNISNFLNISIRDIDDFVAILHKKNNTHYVTFLDLTDINASLIEHQILELEESDNYRINFSEFDSNIIFIGTKSQTQSRTISNPTYTAGHFREFDLKYPRLYKFKDTYQKIDQSNLKWNTNIMSSNYYTNFHFISKSKADKNYFLLHNAGRIYPIRQQISNIYKSAIDSNTIKYFSGAICNDNSFGLFFNKNISLILKDIINLYTKATNAFMLEKNDVFLKEIESISYDTNNLYLNGNESINVLSMNRILSLVTNLQKTLLSNLIS